MLVFAPKFGETEAKRRGYIMRPSVKSSIILRAAGAVAGLWLCGAGAAWAGGGADFGSLTALLTNSQGTGVCDVFHISPCPKPPSITQAALEVAALGNNLFEMLLLQNGFAPASRVKADNPVATAADIPSDSNGNAIFPTASTAPTLLSVLSNLRPLAFNSQSSGTAQVPGTALATQLYDTTADTFLYAVGLSSTERNGQKAPLPVPDYVYFFYDDLLRNNLNFAIGTTVAKFSFPLKVLNGDGTERAVPTTLNFVATNAGDCSMSTVVGDFAGASTATQTKTQTLAPDKIGISCAVVFSASPVSTQRHAIFEVAVPLLVTRASDGKLYFYSFDAPKDPTTNKVLSNPVNSPLVTQGVYTAFESDTGHSPPAGSTYLGTGIAIGLTPSAAPLCSDLPGGCPSTPIPTTFPLCANLPVNTNGTGAQLRPAVGAYYAMATSGEMLLSAPLPAASTSTCSLF